MSGVLLTVENAVVTRGTRTLLDGVSLGLGTGERVGVVGRNGAGKSTLLKVITGDLAPEAGRVVRAGSIRVGSLAQDDRLPVDATVRTTVVGHVADHVWAADPRQRGVLTGLGLIDQLDRVIGPMSGGERRRVALAALLVADLDVLVLDEPTNHLDVEGVAWLARHLAGWRGGLVVATHDRWFLDEVCSRVWEVVDGRVDGYEGGYSAYVLARAERARRADATEARRQNLLRKELAWLRRGPPARTSKPRFRIDAANALIADEPPPREALALRTFAASRLGKDVYDAENVTFDIGTDGGTGDGTDGGTGGGGARGGGNGGGGARGGGAGGGRRLLDDVTWRLGPGDRVGLVGVNGAGKSTLLRLLVGELAPTSGRVKRGASVRQAMLPQEVVSLDPELRALEAVEQVGRLLEVGKGREMTAGQLLEQFGLASSRQWTRVAELSGGERRRLQLLRLLMDRPNVLLLDEPTNDLDTDTLTALEDLLDSWPGTLIVVSHDRYFLERTCDTVWSLFGDGRLTMLVGGVDEYLARRAAAADLPPGGSPATAPRGRPTSSSASSASSSGSAARAASSSGSSAAASSAAASSAAGPSAGGSSALSGGQLRAARKELTKLERTLDRLTRREQELHLALAEAATDHQRLLALDAELRGVVGEKTEVEEAWLTLADNLESPS